MSEPEPKHSTVCHSNYPVVGRARLGADENCRLKVVPVLHYCSFVARADLVAATLEP